MGYAQMSNSGSITVQADAILHIPGNFINNTNGTILNNGIINIGGNWTNNDNAKAFNLSSAGTVNFTGGNQTIGGTQETIFPSVNLLGTGNKVLNINTSINGTLNLNDRQLKVEEKELSVINANANPIAHTSGFISTDLNGKLYRSTNSTSEYNFPLGSDKGGILKLRPVYVSPLDNQSNAFGVGFLKEDPANYGFNSNQKRFDINQVNTTFFHVLDQKSGTGFADFKFYFDNPGDGNFNQLVKWAGFTTGWEKAGISNLQTVTLPLFPLLNSGMTFRSSESLTNLPIALANITPNNDPLTFFNSFTPNGDGKNDRWVIKNIDLFPDNEISILNRWGGEVFNAKSYNSTNAWDGLGLNSGTYYYLLKVNVNGESKVYKGFITLLRNE